MAKIQKQPAFINFPKEEEQTLKYWKENNILEKSLKQTIGQEEKVFYDGPITANGSPHHGHGITFSMKDIFPRYWTMKGYHVTRSLGWDCQGIPVEFEVEKKLGFKEKKDIEKYGIEKFNQLCRESVEEYKQEMIDLEERVGRLTNSEEEYSTMDKDYIESIWWSLKELYNKKFLYEGFKVVPYSTRAGTILSNAEVALGGYSKIVDPAVTIKFQLKDQKNTYFLAWTTTPWTLPTNFALAIGKDIKYVKVVTKKENYILAEELVEKYFGKNAKTEHVDVKDLINTEYIPLFDYFPGKKNAYKVYEGFHVTTESGTGIVHMAPYGAEDNEIFSKEGIESIDVLDDQGDFTKDVSDLEGKNYKDANPIIIDWLKDKNLLFKHEDYEHDMPMCWRTKTPLIYKPVTSWFIKMSSIRQRLVELNNTVTWVPAHVKAGRFGKWLEEIKDWNISRFRYWGTPLPIWKGEQTGKTIVIGSYEELEKYSGKKVEDPHRPFIDEITFVHEGETYTRIQDVIDVWYDSGAMPFARFHYPFKNKEKFNKKFPADYISESVDQTRGWFYSLLAISSTLFDSVAYKSVVMSGFVTDDKGVKLSKSKANYKPPMELINEFGSDALRINFFSTPISSGEDTIVTPTTLKQITQEYLIPLWNVFSYFTIYAELHNFELSKDITSSVPDVSNLLDKWIIELTNKVTQEVNDYLDAYNVQKATEKLWDLTNKTSKWYIRNSRDRFVSGDPAALKTLYFILHNLVRLYAPFVPFITEQMYQNFVTKLDDKAPESVHLTSYPTYSGEINLSLLKQMEVVQEISTIGQNLRIEKGIKLRQPLAKVIVTTPNKLETDLTEIIKNELNVKEVMGKKGTEVHVELDTELTPELKEEGLLTELKRQIQNMRKNAHLKIGEVISEIIISTNSKEIETAISKHQADIAKAVSAEKVTITKVALANSKEVQIDTEKVNVGLVR